MKPPTKADQQAADRLLRRAVDVAIADLRTPLGNPSLEEIYERNVARFTEAIHSADMLLATS